MARSRRYNPLRDITNRVINTNSSVTSLTPSSTSTLTSTASTPGNAATAPATAQSAAHEQLEELIARSFSTRAWNPVTPDIEGDFKLITYNILSNKAVQASKDKYVGYTPDPTNWENRRGLLLDEIKRLDADICCIQELDEDDYHAEFGTSMASFGYSSVFRKRSGNLQCGDAIFFSKSRVTLVEDIDVGLGPSQGWRDRVKHAGVLLNLDVSVGTDKRRLCVGTAHLQASKSKNFVRLDQLVRLVTGAQASMKDDTGAAYVLCGDFNLHRSCLFTDYVESGRVDLSTVRVRNFASIRGRRGIVKNLSAVFSFKKNTWPERSKALDNQNTQALALRQSLDGRSPILSHTLQMSTVYSDSSLIDYIFFGNHTQSSPKLKVIKHLEMTPELARLRGGLPAGNYGSDHFSLGAEFSFIA
ncbi:Protein angel 2 [Mortierella sp. GBA30]|nr:Protein angel 2 [Mortierella sp. GBA30]